jgi:hypothetical protein
MNSEGYYEINDDTIIESIPGTVTKISVDYPFDFGEKIQECDWFKKLPDSLTELDIRTKFTYSLETLPNLSILSINSFYPNTKLINSSTELFNLSSLTLKGNFNSPIDFFPQIFPNLKKLTLGYAFDHSVDNLPKTLQYLNLGGNFSHSLDNLPNSLTELVLGNNFNHPIDNLPHNLKSLTLGNNFDHPIDNLPLNLESLILGYNYSHPLDNLPPNLKRLVTGCRFNKQLNKLPESLTHLQLGHWENKYSHPINLPDKLEEFICYSNVLIKKFPSTRFTIVFPQKYKYIERIKRIPNVRIIFPKIYCYKRTLYWIYDNDYKFYESSKCSDYFQPYFWVNKDYYQNLDLRMCYDQSRIPVDIWRKFKLVDNIPKGVIYKTEKILKK